MKTVSIIGNRPQLMKLIPELGDVVLWTGQHYSDSLRNAYSKQLDRCGEVVDLGVRGFDLMVSGLEAWIKQNDVDLITVYGDTDTTAAGALSAKNRKIKLVHVEAGLRCGNLDVPEEVNRISIDRLCDIAFPTTNQAIRNIPKYELESALVVGDIMQERLWEFWNEEMGRQIPTNKNEKWICTVHRAENSGQAEMMQIIKNICTYVRRPRIYLHPKGEHLFTEFEKTRLPAINDAISYHEMMRELWNCEGVITDSGGLLREAAWLGKPCIVLRNECEFPELVEANRIELVGQSETKLRAALESKDWGCKVELENPDTTGKILKHLGIERRFYAETSEIQHCGASLQVV